MGRFICWCLCVRQTAALSVSLSLFASFRRSTPERREEVEVESTVELPDVKCSLLIQHCVGQHHRGTMNCVKKKKINNNDTSEITVSNLKQ